MRHLLRDLIFIVCLLAGATGAAQASLASGEPLPAVTLPDAHGNTYRVPYSGVRYVLFGADMDANALIERAFGELDSGEFTAAGLVYVADISAMPALVARLFAMPALRDYPFRVLLAREAAAVAFFPRQAGAVTVVNVTPQGEVVDVRFVRDETSLASLLPASE